MRHVLLTIMMLAALSFFSCNNNPSTDCDESINCLSTEPLSGNLNIRVSPDAENPAVVITVYFGQFENGEVYFTDTLTGKSVTYPVYLDQYYSASAKYLSGQDTVYAIDGDRVDLNYAVNCGYDCWTITEGNLDLRLAK